MAVMSTFKQQCPSCEAMISVKESMIGKKVECTKCKDKFVAERPDDEDDAPQVKASAKKDTKLNGKKNTAVKEAGVTAKTPLPAGKRPKLEVDDEDDDEESGKPQTKTGKNKAEANGKSNGKPPSKSHADDEDDIDEDEEEGTSKKKKKVKAGAGSSNKLIIGLGLAVVGVIILVVAAMFVMNSNKPAAPRNDQAGGGAGGAGGGAGGGGGGGVKPIGGVGDPNNDKNKLPPDGPKIDFKPPVGPAIALTDAEIAKLSNLLPNDTEHVFHVFAKDLFNVNSSLREAAFNAPGALDDAELKKHLGFSVLAIDDIIVAEKYTSPSWKYTVLHFSETIKEDTLKTALKLEAVKIDGQTCYKTAKAHPWLDHLARFSFGVPNQLRALDSRPRDKASVIRVHNAQTLIIADEAPVKALLAAKGQFPLQSTKQPPVNPNPAGMGGGPNPGMIGGSPNPGMIGGGPNPGMIGGGPNPAMMGGGPNPGMIGGTPMPMPGTMGGTTPPMPMPGMMGGGLMTGTPSPGMMGGTPNPMMMGGTPNPMMMGGTPNPMMMGGAPNPLMMGGGPNPNMGGGTPNPNMGGGVPAPPRDERYMTIKPALKSILDRMETRSPDGKEKVLFSSVTDMDANRLDVKDFKDTVVRRPRQFWDVTILLTERKPRIRNLGASLIQKETLKYQFRNELLCAQEIDAKEFHQEMMDRTAFQVARFIQTLTKHEVRLPTVEKEKPVMPPGPMPPGPRPPMPMPPGPMPPGPMPPGPMPPQPEEKKPQEATVSRITLSQDRSTVEFVLDLVLDNPALTHIQAISTLVASATRGEMEASADASLRHALGKSGLLVGEKGLTDREVPQGRFPPGAFKRDRAAFITDREPRNRISWMAGLLPHLGHQNLYNKVQFNQSWRESNNWMAGNTVVPQFLDPMYPDTARYVAIGDLPLDFAATHYVGIAGIGLDAASYKRGDPATDHKRGVLGYDDSASLAEVRAGRGISNTILMAQVPHDGVTGVSPWIAGGGATLRGVPEKNSIAPFVLSTDRNGKAINHQNKRGTFVMMTDGSVRFIDQNVSDEVFKAMCTVGGPSPKAFDLDKIPNTPLIPAPVVNKEDAPPVDVKPPEKQPPVEKKPVQREPEKAPAVVVPDDAKLLQGVWTAVQLEAGGQPAPPQMVKEFRLIFKGDRMFLRINATPEDEHTFKIDATKSPKHLDFTKVGSNQAALSIYEMKNGELRVYLATAGSPGRPAAFATQANGSGIVAVLRKQP